MAPPPTDRYTAAAAPAAEGPGKDKLLLWATTAWFIVTFMRPESMIPGLKGMFLGLISDVAIVALLIPRLGSINLTDPILCCYFVLMAVITSGAAFAVNTYWVFQTFITMLTYGVVFLLAVPILLRRKYCHTVLIRTLILSVVVTALWAFSHKGRGQGAWLGDENDVALFLNIGVCFSYFYSREAKTTATRRLLLLVSASCATAVVATFSRGGFVGLAVGIVAIAVYSRRFLKIIAPIVLLVIVCLPILATIHPPAGRGKYRTYLEEMLSIGDHDDGTRRERIYTWTGGWVMFKANPILGVGAGNYPYALGHYELSPELVRLNSFRRSFGGRVAHSLYFTLLPELGSVGTAAFLVMWVATIRRTWRASGSTEDTATRSFASSVGSALLSYSACSAFLSALYYPPFWLLCGFALTLAPKTVHLHAIAKRAAPTKNRITTAQNLRL